MRIPTVFIDETGTTHDPANMIFGIGALLVDDPISFAAKIKDIRNKHQYYEDIKFNKISEDNSQIIRDLLTLFLEPDGVSFSYTLYDKRTSLPVRHWELYLHILVQTINEIDAGSALALVLDYISIPKKMSLSSLLDEELQLAIHSAITVSSRGVDLIQLCDLLLGLVAYKKKLDLDLVKGDEFKLGMVKEFYRLIIKKG